MKKWIFGLVFFVGYILFSFLPISVSIHLEIALLILIIINLSRTSVLWGAFLLGFIKDLHTHMSFFGHYCLVYLIAAIIGLFLKKYFQEEKIISMGLFTYLLAIIFSLFELIFLPFSDPKLPIRFSTIIIDAVLYPLLDAISAMIFVFFPLYLIYTFGNTKIIRQLIKKFSKA